MKNCNNCGTINFDSTIQCEYCNMKGQFTFHSLPIKKVESSQVVCCPNCGTHETGEGKKCMQCHFPISKSDIKDDGNSISLKSNFRAAQ